MRSRNGFALVITIALMAFLVLLLLSLTVISQVETQTVSNVQQTNIARENAMLALNVAVGQLQRYAGPDQRVTAHSGINPANANNPFWTGVWDTETASPPVWLVSGNEGPQFFSPDLNLNANSSPFNEPDPVDVPNPLNGDLVEVGWIRLVNPVQPGTGPAEGGVVVPRVPLRARGYPGLDPAQDVIIGHYAYWVGDEGTKVSFGLKERHRETYEHENNAELREEYQRQLRQLTSQRFWFATDIPSDQFNIIRNYPQFDLRLIENERLPLVLHRSQFLLPFTEYGPAPHFVYQNPPSDTIPPTSWLRDGRNPNLNTDDLAQNFHSIAPINYGVLANTLGGGLRIDLSSTMDSDLRDYFDVTQIVPGTDDFYIRRTELVNPTVGDPIFSLSPVITELRFRYKLWTPNPSDGELHIELEADVELWNPYNVDLVMQEAPHKLTVYLQDLPDITVRASDQNNDPRTINLSELLMDHGEISITTIGAGDIEVYSLSVKDAGPALDKDGFNISFGADPHDPTDPESSPRQLTLAGLPGTVKIELWDEVPTFPTEELPLARSIVSFPAFTVTYYDAYEDDEDAWRFGFYMRMQDELDEPEWLRKFDPRGLDLQNAFETENPVNGATKLLNDDDDEHLLDGSRKIKLFEVPLQEQVSMGALQHLQRYRMPAYALGNWWGENVNDDFDRFFLSTIPQSATDSAWRFPLPNTRLVPFRDATGYDLEASYDTDSEPEKVAQHLLVSGMFNINSTSVNAWRSVLSAINIRGDLISPVPEYKPDPDESGNPRGGWILDDISASPYPLERAIFRFSQTGHLLSEYESQLEDIDYYIQGVRELTPLQVRDLADEIVDQLQLRGYPFYSLSEFAEDGLLESAIDESEINGSLPAYSPSFITAGDILTAIAPFMAARSDTFIVRAYGDAHHPITGRTTRAYCEAIVQRVPTPLDPTESNIMNPGGKFGRKFEIVHFRWLRPEDL